MKTNEVKDKFAELWRKSREDGNKSQEYMAKSLGVSKRTVQNWEAGISCPTQLQGFEWFSVLGIAPLPYYLYLLYEDTFDGISPTSTEENIDKALLTCIKTLTNNEKRKLLYFLYGDHGSSPGAVLDMLTAYLHIPLASRLNVCSNIITNYEIAKEHNFLVNPTHIRPNEELLTNAYELAKKAVLEHKTAYNTVRTMDK